MGVNIEKVGIEFFEDALAAQPLYHLKKEDWKIWLDRIVAFCEADQVKCLQVRMLRLPHLRQSLELQADGW